jgi:hypothetical protein
MNYFSGIILFLFVMCMNDANAGGDDFNKASRIIKELAKNDRSLAAPTDSNFLREVKLTEKEKDSLMLEHADNFTLILSEGNDSDRYNTIYLLGELGKRSVIYVPMLRKLQQQIPKGPASKTYHGAIEPALRKILTE